MAALQGDVETIESHIEAKTDLNQKDAFGSSPLILACLFGKPDVVYALVQGGADMTIPDNYGSTPLHVAALFGHDDIVKILLRYGADRHLRNDDGSTPFDLVAVPFEADRKLYDQLQASLGPLGLKLDYEHLRTIRPVITEMLAPEPAELRSINFEPAAGQGWEVSDPMTEGVNPVILAELYYDALQMPDVYGLVVAKNGKLIAEKYFNGSSIEKEELIQSVSKSYASALVGIALGQGHIKSLDDKLLAYIPEYQDLVDDPDKGKITIRQMLQMRSGFPWEETDTALWNTFIQGDQLPLLQEVDLVNRPGEAFNYSNLTSYLLDVVVQNASNTNLEEYAISNLFLKIQSEPGAWYQDTFGFYYNLFTHSARDLAAFGQLYLNGGNWKGEQIIPEGYVEESLTNYSDDTWLAHARQNHLGRYFTDLGYGYQWWSASVGDINFDMAMGHGGQFVVLLREWDMVIVLLSNPYWLEHNNAAWRSEQSNANLLGKFIRSLAEERQGEPHH